MLNWEIRILKRINRALELPNIKHEKLHLDNTIQVFNIEKIMDDILDMNCEDGVVFQLINMESEQLEIKVVIDDNEIDQVGYISYKGRVETFTPFYDLIRFLLTYLIARGFLIINY